MGQLEGGEADPSCSVDSSLRTAWSTLGGGVACLLCKNIADRNGTNGEADRDGAADDRRHRDKQPCANVVAGRRGEQSSDE